MSDTDLCGLLLSITSTEALRKAFADSKSAGRNKGLLPLAVDFSIHEPSIRDLEQYLTALARSWQLLKDTGSVTVYLPASVVSTGEIGVPGGESTVGDSSLTEI